MRFGTQNQFLIFWLIQQPWKFKINNWIKLQKKKKIQPTEPLYWNWNRSINFIEIYTKECKIHAHASIWINIEGKRPVARCGRDIFEQFRLQGLVFLQEWDTRSIGQVGSVPVCSPSIWIWSPFSSTTQLFSEIRIADQSVFKILHQNTKICLGAPFYLFIF